MTTEQLNKDIQELLKRHAKTTGMVCEQVNAEWVHTLGAPSHLIDTRIILVSQPAYKGELK